MARVTNIPTIGKRTIFTAQTDRRAGIGRPDLRLSLISIRAKDTPKRIRVMGTVIAPISLAFMANGLSESVVKDGGRENKPVSIKNPSGGFPSGPFHEGPPSKLTNNAFSESTDAISKEIATVVLIGVATAASTCLNRDVAPG